MSFALIFTIIFVISKSKYVDIRSLKAIRGISLSEVHPKKFNKIQKMFNNIYMYIYKTQTNPNKKKAFYPTRIQPSHDKVHTYAIPT